MLRWRCPVCGQDLMLTEKTYGCANGHRFDRAKSGYVNLLPSSAGGKRHGDDKMMILARTAFLRKGFYDPLADKIARLAVSFAGDTVTVLDAGCGEATYTKKVQERLTEAGKTAYTAGTDISKEALLYASRYAKDVSFAVASSAALPLFDHSVDILLNVFSPFIGTEFHRVLKPTGKLIRVYPLEKHLWELKELVYDVPYENKPIATAEEGFRIAEEHALRYSLTLGNNADILNLFKMTPYYYKTGIKDQEKALHADQLTLSVEFGITVYEPA